MITVVAAMEQELAGLRRDLPSQYRGSVDFQVAGIGKEQCQFNVAHILDSRAWRPGDCLLMVGFAGGLDPSLKTGDLVLPNFFYSESGDVIAADSELWQQARVAAVESSVPLVQCNSLSVEEIVSKVREKRELYRKHQVGSVNMEDYWVAKLAADAAVPFLSVRAILDPSDWALPKYVLGLAGHPFKAAVRAVSGQGRVRVMWELARMKNQAQASLTRFGLAVISRQLLLEDRQLVAVG